MIHFRKFIPIITLALLLGFMVITLEESFGCADGIGAASCEEDCCPACLTLNNMNSSPESEATLLSVLAESKAVSFFSFSLHSDPFLSNIDRPPII